MQTNLAVKREAFTAGGAPAFPHLKPIDQLRRSVASCLLWESEFYEDGKTIADRICELSAKVSPVELSALAIEARHKFNLRHVPLLLTAELAKRGGSIVSDTLLGVIQRADELPEFLSIYWRNGKTPLSKQVKIGLGKAFRKFDAYALAKYDREKAVKLRDVLFLSHAKPKDEAQAALWKQLIEGTLPEPDTWENALSRGDDKKATWERMLREQTLGYLALLRNLRNMVDVGVDVGLIKSAILARKGANRVLPFRYVAAARACPRLESVIDKAMIASFEQQEKLPGKTVLIVDISGSMNQQLSAKSDMSRVDAACALAAVVRGLCIDVSIYATAGDDYKRTHATALVPDRAGMALVDAIKGMNTTLGGGGIFLRQVMDFVEPKENFADRVIVITDEQDCGGRGDSPLNAKTWGRNNYMINVASNKNGVGYGKWKHIDGFSENVLRWITEVERDAG